MPPANFVSSVKLLACDWANSVTARATAEGTQAFAHSPYGHRSPIEEDESGPGFNGQHLERDGAYLLGHGYRAYRPALARFTAPDSYSPFWGGGVNCYGYCRGEPVNRVDPSGHADENTLNYVLIGLGIFAGVGGFGLAALKPKFAGLGIGIGGGGILAAGTAGIGVGAGAFNEDLHNGLNIAAISLLVGGAMVGGGMSIGGARKSTIGASNQSLGGLKGKELWAARSKAQYMRPTPHAPMQSGRTTWRARSRAKFIPPTPDQRFTGTPSAPSALQTNRSFLTNNWAPSQLAQSSAGINRGILKKSASGIRRDSVEDNLHALRVAFQSFKTS